jgi:uncharacterized protein (TIGR02444 family)
VTERGSPFWRFSLRTYALPGVAPACLALQEEAGVDVNLLLFLMWAAGEGRRADDAEVASLEALVRPWREGVVKPLRAARQTLKALPPPWGSEAAAALRQQVKARELEAERLQQEVMFAARPLAGFGQPEPDPRRAAEAGIAAYARMLGRVFPAEPVTVLLQAGAPRP